MARLPAYGIETSDTIDFIVKVHECFSGDSAWFKYQEKAAEYLQDEEIDSDDLFLAMSSISDNCQELSKEALSAVTKLNGPNKSNKRDVVTGVPS